MFRADLLPLFCVFCTLKVVSRSPQTNNAEGNKDVIFMKRSYKILFLKSLIVAICSAGCANAHKHEDSTQKKYIERVQSLEKEVQDLVVQNSVLKSAVKKKLSVQNSHKLEQKSTSPAVPLQVPHTPVEPEISGEHSLYTSLLQAYWEHDLDKVKRLNSMLLKTYPTSVFADNALFLQASLSYSQGSLGETLQTLNRLIQSYPQSNKVVAAKLLKASLFRRLNLPAQANEIFEKVARDYPGSTEARLAQLEYTKRGKK